MVAPIVSEIRRELEAVTADSFVASQQRDQQAAPAPARQNKETPR